jgi:hypothetical protein
MHDIFTPLLGITAWKKRYTTLLGIGTLLHGVGTPLGGVGTPQVGVKSYPMTPATWKRNAAEGVGPLATRNWDAAARNWETLWLRVGTLQRVLGPLPPGVGTPLQGVREECSLRKYVLTEIERGRLRAWLNGERRRGRRRRFS